jgi:hypothetical protein
VLSALSVLLSACSDDSTEQNALLTPHLPFVEFAVRETTITATGGYTFKQFVPMNGTINLVGRSGNYSASAVLAFYASYFPDRDTVNVLSATLYLHGASFFGDSTGQVGFDVYRLNRTWNQASITWDSVQSSFYDASVLRGSYTGRIGLDTEQVAVQLDTAMARQWMVTETATDYGYRYGFILVPNAASTVIRGFHSFESDSASWVPSLRLICQNVAGTVTDTTMYSLGVDTFVGNVDPLDVKPDRYYVQAGVVYRSVMNFDVSFLRQGTIVNSGILTMQRDPATSWLNRFALDTAVAIHIMGGPASTSAFSATSVQARLVPGSSVMYTADVHSDVQAWIRGPNYGIMLRTDGAREYQALDLVTIFNHAAAPALKPRLKLIYSVPKN